MESVNPFGIYAFEIIADEIDKEKNKRDMAVGPHILNENFLREVDEYEKKIDSKLSCLKISTGGYINLDVPNGMSVNHFNVIKQRYLKAGWKDLVWNSDQREGQWLTFKN